MSVDKITASMRLKELLEGLGYDEVNSGWKYLTQEEKDRHETDGLLIVADFRNKGKLDTCSFILGGSADIRVLDRILKDLRQMLERGKL